MLLEIEETIVNNQIIFFQLETFSGANYDKLKNTVQKYK